MRKVMMVMSALMLSIPVFAADTSAEQKESTDTSRNPITGSTTTTKKYKRKAKHSDGTESSANVKEATKVKRDGTVEKNVETKKVDAPVQE